jgi:hypothetical protein
MRDDPRCLPPTRTLRRIRWPLQPRFRDRPSRFWRVLTTVGRRSHVILGLGRSFTIHPLFTAAAMKADHQPSFRSERSARRFRVIPPFFARPPFTPTATLFGALRGCLFEARTLPADFCNFTRRTDTFRELSFPRRDEGHDLLPFLTHHARRTRVAPK